MATAARRFAVCCLALLAAALAGLLPVAAGADDTNWSITSFASDITVQKDGSIDVQETIKVDFATPKHGIFRDIPYLFDYDAKRNRVNEIDVVGVGNGRGGSWPYTVSDVNGYRELKIGDPNQTVTGSQAYLIHYRVRGALNAFADHDELNWNVNGSQWPVPAASVSAAVHLPAGSFQKATCFQGPTGSTQPCAFARSQDQVTYQATRALQPGEQLTVTAAFAKGAVAVPAPILQDRPRDFFGYWEVNPATVTVTLLLLLAGLGLVGYNWLVNGRDQRALDIHYADSGARPLPLFGSHTIVAEFDPPGGLRPAEMGTLLDERADTKDVTATIVDLAARGFLRIDPLVASPGGTPHDWRLTWTGPAEWRAGLKPYEAQLLTSLFEGRTSVEVSDLKGTFAGHLQEVESMLYQDANSASWFVADPRYVRLLWAGVGVVIVVAGVVLVFGLGQAFGWALPGLAVIVVGVVQFATGFGMPRRTPAGSDLLQHVLGFRLYMRTAETYRQQFAEKENLFTSLLPYAVVFGCVDRWARAFEGMATQPGQTGWYGPGGWQALALSQSLSDFNTHLGQTLAAPAPSAGGSGFGGGGFSGGGFGGGGGGSW